MFPGRPTFVVVFLCVACGRAPTGPSPVEPGVWGGDHVTLTVGDETSHLEFDCAHGEIPGALHANHGEIKATGTFVREHGGPIRVDEPVDAHPAVYSGTLSASTMQLSVRLTDSGDVIGSFTLARGVTGRVVKCL
jgi:hypothetical protein